MKGYVDTESALDGYRKMEPFRDWQLAPPLQWMERYVPSAPKSDIAPVDTIPIKPDVDDAPKGTKESGVKFMLTQSDKEHLGRLGYTPEQIFYMRPTEAVEIIKAGTRAPHAEATDTAAKLGTSSPGAINADNHTIVPLA